MEDLLVPLIWLLIAILFIVFESLTFNLFTIWFATGAIAALFVSIFLPEYYLVQAVVFVGVSIFMLLTIRNYAVKKLNGPTIKTNVNSLIGKKAVVTKLIDPFKYGEVKIDGNYWTAKSLNDEIIEVNSIVEIIEISGVKLIVKIIK